MRNTNKDSAYSVTHLGWSSYPYEDIPINYDGGSTDQ